MRKENDTSQSCWGVSVDPETRAHEQFYDSFFYSLHVAHENRPTLQMVRSRAGASVVR